ncbi:hypothetical protein PVK06_042519 [Gossypium arboreum]|uniref:Uncharacterized protein n=1 Tax=Gossypium arboreum TaxID=29729 RepID=A0ABR0MLH4_GOSAR|nr:hypothetical protein PVK06_042519 [Gossypium arboreum]
MGLFSDMQLQFETKVELMSEVGEESYWQTLLEPERKREISYPTWVQILTSQSCCNIGSRRQGLRLRKFGGRSIQEIK